MMHIKGFMAYVFKKPSAMKKCLENSENLFLPDPPFVTGKKICFRNVIPLFSCIPRFYILLLQESFLEQKF